MLHLARQGVRARAGAVLAAARGHRAQLPGGPRLPGPASSSGGPAAAGRPRAGLDRRRPAEPSGPTAPATRCRPCRCWTPSRENVRRGVRRRPARRGAGRAKERIFSLRDAFGGWDPRRQRPELWDLYNGRHAPGEHVRVFPLSNWTELDVWHYIERESIELPSIYYAHEREVFRRDGMWLAAGRVGRPARAASTMERTHGALPDRRRHVVHRRGGVDGRQSRAVIAEITASRLTERGATRADDRLRRPPWKTASAKGTSDP